MKNEILQNYVSKIINNANNTALIWWTTLSLQEQVKRAYEWNGEVSFNLTLRDISFLHQQELKNS